MDYILVLFQAIALLIVALGVQLDPYIFTYSTVDFIPRWFRYLFLIDFCIFALFFLYSSWQLGRHARATPRPADNAILRSNGLYKYCRHPMYTSLMGMSLGWAFYTLSITAFGGFIFLSIILNIKSKKEEKYLLEKFGEAYQSYMNKTGRFF